MTVPLWVCIGLVMLTAYITGAWCLVRKAKLEKEKEAELTSLKNQVIALRALKTPNSESDLQLQRLWIDYCKLEDKYNVLLARPIQTVMAAQFTQDEIKRLIRLCHPDRHNNSDIAKEITQKLLELRQ